MANLTNGTRYTFAVRAVNASGAGPLREVFATPTPPPAAPTGLAARSGDRRVDLNWDLVQGVTRYEYQKRRKTGDDWNRWMGVPVTVIPSPSSGRMWAGITGLVNFTEYQFRLRAVNAAGGGDWSLVTGTPKAPLPDRPTGLTVTPGAQKMTLSWTNPTKLLAADGQRLPLPAPERQRQRLDGLDGHLRRRKPRRTR